jgi:hypothetical protein
MSQDPSYEMITIAVEPYEDETQAEKRAVDNQRGWGGEAQASKNIKQEKTMTVDDLEQKMSGFLQMVSRVFSSAEKEAKKTAGMCLDEIELSVEIGAEGELRLIGSGAKATGKSAIKLKFKRVKEE